MRAVHILSDGRKLERIDGHVISGDAAVRLVELLRRRKHDHNERIELAAAVRERG